MRLEIDENCLDECATVRVRILKEDCIRILAVPAINERELCLRRRKRAEVHDHVGLIHASDGAIYGRRVIGYTLASRIKDTPRGRISPAFRRRCEMSHLSAGRVRGGGKSFHVIERDLDRLRSHTETKRDVSADEAKGTRRLGQTPALQAGPPLERSIRETSEPTPSPRGPRGSP